MIPVVNDQTLRRLLIQRRILRLSDEALADLQFRLSAFFGRYATTEDYMLTHAERSLVRRRD